MNEFEKLIEQMILWDVLSEPSRARRFKSHMFMTDGVRALFEILQPYVTQYQQDPSLETVRALVRLDEKHPEFRKNVTDDMLAAIYAIRNELPKYSREWLRDEITPVFVKSAVFNERHKQLEMYKAMNPTDMSLEQYGNFIDGYDNVVEKYSDYEIDDDESRTVRFLNAEDHKRIKVERTPTGYGFLDDCLCGGFAAKTLNVFAGPPKVGKSMWLCNLCANAVRNGENSVYITLELDPSIVNQRISANLFGVGMRDYENSCDDEGFVRGKLDAFSDSCSGKPGHLTIREFPTGTATASDIECFIKDEEKLMSTPENPFAIKNVYIDYINLMADRRGGRNDNTYITIKHICEDVRAMAQRNGWCVVTLTQATRSAYGGTDMELTDISESSGTIATADSVFGIIQTYEMSSNGVYYIKALALRNSPHMGDRKRFTFDKDFLRITEDTTPVIPAGMKIDEELDAEEERKFEKANARIARTDRKPSNRSNLAEVKQVAVPTILHPSKSMTQSRNDFTLGENGLMRASNNASELFL